MNGGRCRVGGRLSAQGAGLTLPEGADIRVVRFGNFEVDLRSGELRRNGLAVKLYGQPFQVLAMLLERPGELVTREEIRQRLWPADTFVDFEHSLNTAIKRLRDALGESGENPVFIETLPRRGYRLRAPVQTTTVTRPDVGHRVVLFGEPTAADKPGAKVPRRQPRIALPVVVVCAALAVA